MRTPVQNRRMLVRGLLLLCASMAASAQTVEPSRAADTTKLSYELVSIHESKPDAQGYDMNDNPEGITARAINLRQLLSEAFGFTFGDLLKEQIVGVPGWAETQRFDIRAKVDDSNLERLNAIRKADTMAVTVNAMLQRKPTPEMAMLQELVVEHFHLKMHYEQRVMPVYAMTQAKGGARLKATGQKNPEHGSIGFSNGKLNGENLPADFITFPLTILVGRPVVNRTDLTGRYDFDLTFSPDRGMEAPAGADTGPSLFTALNEQLGLKLVPAKEPVWVIVVDHVEMPTDN